MSILLLGVLFAAPGHADPVPQHLASMAAMLYEHARAELADPALPPEKREVAERLLSALRRGRIRYWARDPVSLPSPAEALLNRLSLDAADPASFRLLTELLAADPDSVRERLGEWLSSEEDLEAALSALAETRRVGGALATSHTLDVGEGEVVELQWRPESGEFLVRVHPIERGGSEDFEGALVGATSLGANAETGEIDVTLQPAEQAAQLLGAADLERVRQSIFGEWIAENGEIWTFSSVDGEEAGGEIRRSSEEIQAEIRDRQARIQSIREAKEYVWKDRQSEEIVRQRRLRRLESPWEFLGAEYIDPDAETKIARLESEIEALQGELSGETLPPVRRHDPIGFEEASRSGASPLRIQVRQLDGYRYEWDQASFDGRIVRGRRTYRDIRDTTNESLPLDVKRKLVASWSPPAWIELEATIDLVTNQIRLRGQRWSLHVTYSADFFGGNDHTIKSIHSPYARSLTLSKPGTSSQMAFGAADTALP